MDLDNIEGLNEIRPCVYRATMKLWSLQRLCHLHFVSVRHIMAAVNLVGGTRQQDVGLNREKMTWTLNRMFQGVSQEVPGHVTLEATEQTCSLMFRLYERTQSGSVSSGSLQRALIALCSDNLLEKFTALLNITSSGSISRSGLRSLLQDLSQVPAAVQEEAIFGSVEAAVRSCFNGPTWRESLSSLVHSIRHTLLPRRYTQSEADRRRVLMMAGPWETQNSALPPSDVSTRLADSAVRHSPSSDRDASHDASVQPPPSLLCSSKVLQTDESKALTLLTEVRNLQRDKWLLEQEMQAWRLTVQSEQGILEDRCSEMEVTMETLRQHNLHLQGMLTQALNKMEAQQHANNTPRSVDTERDISPISDTQRNTEEEDDEVLKDKWCEDKQTPSPTIHQGVPVSHDVCFEEKGFAGLCCPIGQDNRPEEAELQDQEEEEQEEDCGMCIPEELLQETVDSLKTVMETDRWTERQTGERKRPELLKAVDQVGDSVHLLVDTVRTNTH